MSSEKYIKRS